mmetsp:Transcript_60659/g.162350  ORF Transcript_60659/g.162350 Transcript_60659/m.162350 type:complete len:226 (+) Transcript_60659:569-1246(+)
MVGVLDHARLGVERQWPEVVHKVEARYRSEQEVGFEVMREGGARRGHWHLRAPVPEPRQQTRELLDATLEALLALGLPRRTFVHPSPFEGMPEVHDHLLIRRRICGLVVHQHLAGRLLQEASAFDEGRPVLEDCKGVQLPLDNALVHPCKVEVLGGYRDARELFAARDALADVPSHGDVGVVLASASHARNDHELEGQPKELSPPLLGQVVLQEYAARRDRPVRL